MLTPVSGFLGGGLEHIQAQNKDSPEQLRKVGAEFESLLLTQMLKSMRESSSGGWLGGGEDQAGTVMVEMAEQQLARALAASGGLGIADLVVEGMVDREAEITAKEDPNPVR